MVTSDFLSQFTLPVLIRILMAMILGGLIGFERGRHGRAAGLRTHILVCVGSAMTALTGVFGAEALGGGDPFRISAQVVSGIGFLGVGMILVRNRTLITGLTTAAGLWATATIGIAVGYGFYAGAIISAVLCVAVFTVLGHIEEKKKSVTNLYLEISNTSDTGSIVREIRALLNYDVTVNVTSPKSNCAEHLGVLLLVKTFAIPEEKVLEIEKINGVAFVVEECNA
ncbi:MAG: MgtC/SapB family protein [Ruminococcaceae bacterium]|nr:MgtC/SapB family protein [Oscillospiraceae bacterium]